MKFIFQPKALKVPFFISVALNALIWILLLWRLSSLSDTSVLHYTIYFGIDSLGPAWQLLYVPLVGLVFLLLNNFIVLRRKSVDLVAYILLYISLVIQVLLGIMAVLLILVNI